MGDHDYDVLVIGSGFGGSVTALRLTEKGYRVGVFESGRRWDAESLPKSNWNARESIWAPKLGLTGPQRISILGKCMVSSAAAVGGGSIIYGNTLYQPLEPFYRDKQWAHITDWKAELAPYYDQAKRMLGVNPNPRLTPADEVVKQIADDLGVGHTFHATDVGVFFNEGHEGQEVADPYFGGAGPRRAGCIHCARCLTGCPHNAKNTMLTNYLYLAEQAGAQVHPLTTVTSVRCRDGGGYEVDTVRANGTLRRGKKTSTAEQVVFAAAALGTQKLLHKLKDNGTLPALSPRLGDLSRSNSEAILGAVAKKRGTDFAQGVAITSSIHPEPNTHLEVCHYGKGQNALFCDDGAHGRRRTVPVRALLARQRAAPDRVPALAQRPARLGAQRNPAVHAVPGQLPHVLPPTRTAAHQAGHRRAEPHLDPDRPRHRETVRAQDRR